MNSIGERRRGRRASRIRHPCIGTLLLNRRTATNNRIAANTAPARLCGDLILFGWSSVCADEQITVIISRNKEHIITGDGCHKDSAKSLSKGEVGAVLSLVGGSFESEHVVQVKWGGAIE